MTFVVWVSWTCSQSRYLKYLLCKVYMYGKFSYKSTIFLIILWLSYNKLNSIGKTVTDKRVYYLRFFTVWIIQNPKRKSPRQLSELSFWGSHIVSTDLRNVVVGAPTTDHAGVVSWVSVLLQGVTDLCEPCSLLGLHRKHNLNLPYHKSWYNMVHEINSKSVLINSSYLPLT